ncbi:MAG: hypothetical protein IPJ41_10005 [Phycisphaerales bacterium]|nr:hypothetical protein [Phycisphaerales bacterium]
MLLRRVAEGSAFARPIGGRWKRSYGDLFQADPSSLGTQQPPQGFNIEARRGDYERAIDDMRELPYEVEFSTRPAWVRGRSMSVIATSTTWWPNCSVFYRVRYQSADGSVRGELESNGAFDLPVPDVDHAVIDCEIEIMQKTYYASAPRSVRMMGVEHRTFAFDTLADADAVLRALSSAGLDAYVAAVLTVVWDGGFHASVARPGAPSVAQGAVDVVFAGRLEVLRFGSVVAKSEVAWIPRNLGGNILVAPDFGDWEYAVDAAELGEQLDGDAPIGPGWSVRFVSDSRAALKFLDAKQRWEGSVEIRFE